MNEKLEAILDQKREALKNRSVSVKDFSKKTTEETLDHKLATAEQIYER